VKVSVVGLGKIGLPLAVQYAISGRQVTGVDINPSVVSKVNKGDEPFPGEAHLDSLLPQVVSMGLLHATTDYSEAIPESEFVVVVVPLFVDADSRPDFGWMDSATEAIGKNLTTDTVVIYETTLPVGTTRNRWAPMLEKFSGLIEGSDFDVVFSPERVLTGRVFEDLRKYPKLVGGLSDTGRDRAVSFYEQVLDFEDRHDLPMPNGVWPLGSAEAAEFVKLAETTYRDVNIGLANQFARYADTVGVDILEVIQAANSQPYSHLHLPGIAVGGHCIPVYPRLYLWNDPHATIVQAAREANLSMPRFAIDLLQRELGSLRGLAIGVCGAAYRGGVKETAFSGVFEVVAEISRRGGKPFVSDPLFSSEELQDLELPPFFEGDHLDALVIQADHDEYRHMKATDFPGVKVVVDGRGIINPEGWAKVVYLGRPSLS